MSTNKLINKLVKRLEDNTKESGVGLFSEKQIFKVDATWAHTQVPEVDFNLGTLGFPVGFTEVYGASKSGKTTICLGGMAAFQKKYPEGICVILSSERRDNKQYAEEMGVDTENVIIISSWYLEDLFYKFGILLDDIKKQWEADKMKGKPRIYVMWDSIGATISKQEQNALDENKEIVSKNMEKGTKTELKHAVMGSFAKNAKMLMKGIIGRLYDEEIIMVGINHVIDDFTSGKKVSGGGSWKEFLPTLRLHIKHKEIIKLSEKNSGKELEVEVAQISTVNVEKNDFGSRRPTEMEILFGMGIVLNRNDIQYAVDKGILKIEGAKTYSFMGGKLKWSTKRTFYQNYYDRHPMLPVLHKRVMELRHKDVIATKELD